jgi:hypothetical protein
VTEKEARELHRRSIRVRGYDYSQPGIYFVTICSHNRECIFGEIANGEMVKNRLGGLVAECWMEIPDHFPNVALDAFAVMPNHIHGIIVIHVGARSRLARCPYIAERPNWNNSEGPPRARLPQLCVRSNLR